MQVAERRQRSHFFHQVAIPHKILPLRRKTLRKHLDKSLAAIGKGKTLALQRHHVVRLGIQSVELDLILDTEIIEIMRKHLVVVKASDKMHPRLKLDAIAREALQTTAHL